MNKLNSYQIDEKLMPILRQIEQNGAKIDVPYLKSLSDKFGKQIDKITAEIDKDLGEKINLNSPKQLSELLYKKLKISPRGSGIKRGKSHFSTSAQALEKIRSQSPAIEKILRYRELAKLKNTYIDPLPLLVDKEDRLHTTYAIETSTGRLSSKNPNLQNIPIRTEIGREIRRSFIAPVGCKLVKFDYSQIELRILAHISGDKKMTQIFQSNGYIHTDTAQELGIDRRMAKVVNFGIVYGMSAYGLSERLKIPVEEAQFFIDKYFMTFSGVKKYIDDTTKKVTDDGYVETMFGRKREFPDINSPIERIRSFSERAAINTPIQGTAAEIIKLAMIELSTKFETRNSKQIINHNEINSKLIPYTKYHIPNTVKMILQVHDELVFEIKEKDIAKATIVIKDIMENAVKLDVPLIVESMVGNNWSEME